MGHFFNKTDICWHSSYTDGTTEISYRGGNLANPAATYGDRAFSPDFHYLDLIFWFINQI